MKSKVGAVFGFFGVMAVLAIGLGLAARFLHLESALNGPDLQWGAYDVATRWVKERYPGEVKVSSHNDAERTHFVQESNLWRVIMQVDRQNVFGGPQRENVRVTLTYLPEKNLWRQESFDVLPRMK